MNHHGAGTPPSGGKRDRVERLADALVPRRLAAYSEQLLYLGIGGWNTLFGYLNFVVLYFFLHEYLHVTIILLLSYALSIANAYICYRYIVFRSRGSVIRELPRFTSVYLVALAANLVVLPLALRLLPINAYVAQGAFTVAVVVLSYLGHRHFSFAQHRSRGAGSDTEGSCSQGNGAACETSPRDPASRGD